MSRDADWFEYGPTVDLAALPPDEAIRILGRPVWEVLRTTWQPPKGSVRVVSVDRNRGVVTVQWEGR